MIRFLLAAAFSAIVSAPALAQPAPAEAPAPREDLVPVAIQTEKGRIVIALDRGRAPLTTANFLAYVESEKFDGETAWDIFFGNTKPEVIMQLDTSNCRAGGADPVEVLNRYPGRVQTIHIKPHGGDAESVIGEDKINWPAVFEFCESKGGTEWYVVEHETSKTPIETVRRTFEVLRGLGKV